MIYLDKYTDSILPYGLLATPFETVFRALQLVAGGVWDVDPKVYRGAIAWGYYLQTDAEVLANLDAGRQYIVNILLSEQIPLIKSTQTTAELVELLALWRDYKPTFKKLEELYNPYAAKVNIKPITDAATQEILPVTDINNAFYVVIEQVDWSRPLTLGEATTIAERATPMGSRPFAVFQFEEPINVTASVAYGDVCIYMEKVDPASEPPTPPVPTVYGFIIVNETTGEIESGEQLEELLLSPIGTLMMSDTPMLLIPESVYNTTPLYFTNNGAAETNNHTLSLENALYFADGTRTKNSDVTSLATKPFAFMNKDNQFFMGTNSDELFEMTAVNAGLRCLGSGSSIGKAALLALFEPKTEEVTAYFRSEGSAYEYDTQINQGGGNNLHDASGNSLYYDSSRIYTIVALYNASNELQPCGNGDSINDNSGYLYYSRGTTLSRVYAHHLVFKQTIPPPPSVLSAYFTSQGAAATGDTGLWGNYILYDSAGQLIPAIRLATYTIVAKYNKAGEQLPAQPGEYLYYSQYGLMYDSMGNAGAAYKLTYTVSDNT